MLLLPEFIKALVAKSFARKLAARLSGTVEQEGKPNPKIYVHGQHRGRQVQVFLSVTWGHVSVTVKELPALDLYFHLRSKAAVKRMSRHRHGEYEELDSASGAVLKWHRDGERLDARRILTSLEPGLRERMLSRVKGESAWNWTGDGLEYDHVCSILGATERIIEALELACDVAEGIEALAAQGGVRNADSPG